MPDTGRKEAGRSEAAAAPGTQEVPSRARGWTCVVLGLTIALGLLSRRHPLPGIFAQYTGDALYAAAAFVGYALLLAQSRVLVLAVLAFVSCLLVEFTQLLSWPWLMNLRSTTWGRLLLGAGFNWPDMLAYLLGVSAAAIGDRMLRRRVL